MPIQVAHGERHDRPLWRRVVAGVILLLLIILSLRKTDRIGVLFLVLFVGLYAWYQRKDEHITYDFSVSEAGLMVGPEFYSRESIEGFSIGYKPMTKELRTLYLYTKDQHTQIFSFLGAQDDIQEIAELFVSMKPLISPPRLSPAQKVMQFLRL